MQCACLSRYLNPILKDKTHYRRLEAMPLTGSKRNAPFLVGMPHFGDNDLVAMLQYSVYSLFNKFNNY